MLRSEFMRVPPEKTFDASALWVWIDKLGSNEKRPLGIPTVRGRATSPAGTETSTPGWTNGCG